MAKIYRTTDRIPVQVDDVIITLSPLKYHEKAEIQACVMKGDAHGATQGAALALKYSIKEIKGVELEDGSEYSLDLGPEGNLTEDCISDLLNLQVFDKLIAVSLNLLNGIPDKFVDLATGKKITGVEIVKEKSGKKK